MSKKKAASRGKPQAKGQTPKAYASAIDSKNGVKKRVTAFQAAPLDICRNDKNLQAALKVLLDHDEPSEVRQAALRSLQSASFSVVAFESCRSDYNAALRKLSDDPDEELRERALGILSRNQDSYTQKKLIDGLKKPAEALVSPERALQLLSYDSHAGASKIAREIVENPPSTAAKREALRVLSTDTKSVGLFEKFLRDKSEDSEVRQLSAAALHALQPDKLQEHARQIVLDPAEDGEMQTMCLTALASFGDKGTYGQDEGLKKRVVKLTEASPAGLHKAAANFIEKYGP